MHANRRVLVLGEDTRSFLTVIRSLGRAGVEVHVAWAPLDSAALASRYIHTVHRIPPFRQGSMEWSDRFQELFARIPFDLVLPTTDSSILPFQLHRELFEPLVRVYLLPNRVYQTCANKDATWEQAKRLSIPVPRQVVVRTAQEALSAAAVLGYPLVLKPTASANTRDPLRRQQVEKAQSESDLVSMAERMTANDPVLAQENFIGVGVGVEVLCKDGRILMAFQHERVHEPIKGGGSSYRKSVALDPGMLEATAKLMGALSYTGVAMVEYKQNRATKRWVLIEINARFWGSLALSSAAGLDFPLSLVELLLDDREDFPAGYRIGVFCRHWTDDAQWFLSNLRADKSDPTLLTSSFPRVLLEAVHLLTFRERSDTFVFDDPQPALRDLRLYLGEKLFRVLKRLRPYRAFHRSRLRRLSRDANQVVVLCYGNICRSPFAGALLADRLSVSHRPVISRGLHLKVDRPSPPETIEAAREHGVDLGGHRSSLITLEELHSADVILIFDRKNWTGLRALAPEVMERVAYLGAADDHGLLEIEDPFGGELESFRTCYRRIANAFYHVFGPAHSDSQTVSAQSAFPRTS